jgi:hypothetical protein
MSHQLLEAATPVLAESTGIGLRIPDAPPVEERQRADTPRRQHKVGDRPTLDERRGFRARCERLAASLALADTLGERIELYEFRSSRELSTASALCPDLMPLLNGEFEWLALQSPDVLD